MQPISQNTKIIGVGNYGAQAVKYISANLYSEIEGFSGDDRVKFVMSDVKVSDIVTKALLNNTQLIIVVADSDEGSDAVNSIASVAKKEKKTTVALIKGNADNITSDCDCIVVAGDVREAKNVAECIMQPMYTESLIGADMNDISELLTNCGKANFKRFEGDMDSVMSELEAFSAIKGGKCIISSSIIDWEKYCDIDLIDKVAELADKDATVFVTLSKGTHSVDAVTSILVAGY